MQWSDAAHAGFTTGTPWIEVNGNHREINVAADAADPDGVMAHYRRLIALRRELDIVSHGRFVAHAEDHPAVVAYCRETDDERLAVVANFTGQDVVFAVPEGMAVTGTGVLHTVGPARPGGRHRHARALRVLRRPRAAFAGLSHASRRLQAACAGAGRGG